MLKLISESRIYEVRAGSKVCTLSGILSYILPFRRVGAAVEFQAVRLHARLPGISSNKNNELFRSLKVVESGELEGAYNEGAWFWVGPCFGTGYRKSEPDNRGNAGSVAQV